MTIKLKKPHPKQLEILQQARRFNVLKCGRRFGKTILTEQLAIIPALDGKKVGYWSPTYKDVSNVWDAVYFTIRDVVARKDLQTRQLKLVTGGQIDFWSMEDPNNGRGFAYHRAIIDECEKARHLKAAWEQVIRATLTDYKGDAWLMSTPKFGQTYFKDIAKNKYKKGFEDWQSWVYTTYDNPYLDTKEIDQARMQLEDLVFRCEFMAEDIDIVGKPFAYAFSEEKHVGSCSFDQMFEVRLSFDFNVDPITCLAEQHVNGQIRYIKEFKLPNSDIYELCDRIVAYFPLAVLLVTGDATGQARSALSKGNINYYQIIRQRLNLADPQMRQPTINPAVSDTRVLMNSILQRYSVLIDREHCPGLIYDLKYVEVDDNGDIMKDRSGESKKADLLDCMRYDLNTFHNYMIRILS